MTVAAVLDGGLSTALEQRGADLGDPLWTARVLAEEPERIVQAHRDFFQAGAQLATTSTYQASVPGFVAAGMTEQAARGLILRSVALAKEARDESGGSSAGLRVAASVGPYGAFLADGSEYRGRYGVTASTLRDFHAPRLELLASAEPDLLAVETIPDADEAEVLVSLLDELRVPAWFTYSVRDGETCAGQPLAEAYAVLADSTSLVAAGVNCSAPADILGALGAAASATRLPGVAYPNRGGTWDAASKTWSQAAAIDLHLVDGWVAAGAAYVGGCCGIGPDDLAAVARHLT